ncbi:envelope glycoprotein G [Equid alphaherpesvirus 8]|uniref:Envelope glycoprotein G n=1 Tax=Equid alphaherpesvirus 8 TaxID=39637 RepID=I1V8I4_9ALPH|nr:ORF70 gene product [Equid alphaherpesvirus 8]YP_010795110.1 envelope glycoprotein G [Equid alphaherpesvirus 8]AFI33206.1 envelope glycoprotein G [Equid alphaherpesvirus 8]AUS94723.1 envelope glycoprotein G [Equid alphaherpesvirus 8]AUS94883.1 envelope glycoprotein G [Equid alphaherpesvirus 8]AUS94963.1 envelope glycoprotein G [Equid alphaherpesvirus 8]
MLTLAAALSLLSLLTSVTGRLAPDELCYAEPRRTGHPPNTQPERPPVIFEPPTIAIKAESKGCELILLDPPIDVSYRKEDKVNASVAWFFDFGACRMPIAYREYYGCIGNVIPSPETCDAYSFTLIRTEGIVEFTIVNMSLLFQPGIYDSGNFIYSVLLDYHIFTGRVTLDVEKDTNYPCGMIHGLTAYGDINVDETMDNASPHPRAVGCFPEPINNEAWANVTFTELGIPDPNSFLDDESDYPNISDCHSWESYTYPNTLRQATGPQTLLVGAVGLRILAQAWKFVGDETYDTIRAEAKNLETHVHSSAADSSSENQLSQENVNNPEVAHLRSCQNEDNAHTGGVLNGLQDCDNQLKTVYICLALIGLGTCAMIGLIVYICVLRSKLSSREFSRAQNVKHRNYQRLEYVA